MTALKTWLQEHEPSKRAVSNVVYVVLTLAPLIAFGYALFN